MKNIIEYIEQFLKNKNYEWVNRQIFGNYGYIPAKDSDFTKNEIQDFKLKNKDNELVAVNFLINENLFMVFKRFAGKLRLAQDFSQEWKNYLQSITTKEDEQLKQEIRDYLADKNNDTYNHNSFDDILE